MFFDTPNSTCEVTASEAAEAGLIVTMTCARMSRGYMQSFNLLALKLWPCIKDNQLDRRLLWLGIYIVRFDGLGFISEVNIFFPLTLTIIL